MPKTTTIYGIFTTDDEYHGSFKAYCETRGLAEKHLLNYRDWFCSNPPKPDSYHIRPVELIIGEDDE